MIQVNSRLNQILKSKEQRPITRVEIYDTSNTVPSNGFFTRNYSGLDTTNPDAIKRTQFEPMISYDYSNGLPAPLSNYVGFKFNSSGVVVGDAYSISWSGQFFAPEPGDYTFATRSLGATRFEISGIDLLGVADIIWTRDVHLILAARPI